MNLNLKHGFGVEFSAYEGEMMKEVAMATDIICAIMTHIAVLRPTHNN